MRTHKTIIKDPSKLSIQSGHPFLLFCLGDWENIKYTYSQEMSIRTITSCLVGETLKDSVIVVEPSATLYNCTLDHVDAFLGRLSNCVKISKYCVETKSGYQRWDVRSAQEKKEHPLPEPDWGNNNMIKRVVIPRRVVEDGQGGLTPVAPNYDIFNTILSNQDGLVVQGVDDVCIEMEEKMK